jgi:hypothetical protein
VARLGIIFLYYEIFGVQNFCHFPPIFWHFLTAKIMHRIIYLNYIILYRSICNMPYYIKHLSKVTVNVKKSEKVEHFRGGFKIFSPPFACIIHRKRGPPPGIECQVENKALPQKNFSRESVPRQAGHTSPPFRTHGVSRPITEIILSPLCLKFPEHVHSIWRGFEEGWVCAANQKKLTGN